MALEAIILLWMTTQRMSLANALSSSKFQQSRLNLKTILENHDQNIHGLS